MPNNNADEKGEIRQIQLKTILYESEHRKGNLAVGGTVVCTR